MNLLQKTPVVGRFITVLANFLHMTSASRTLSSKSNGDSDMPTTLAGFGYAFNEVGQLRAVDTETGLTTAQSYQFNVRPGDADYNQRRYEALGDVITEHVYELLEQAGLQRIQVPANVPAGQATTFVFSNRHDVHNSRKLLVLINGSGAVRAGQWARSLIINMSLDHGSQLPYIRRALSLGYDILILNTNDNARNGTPIRGSADATEHATTVWRQLFGVNTDDSATASPPHIAFAAHSYGGIIVQSLSRAFRQQFIDRVFAIAFTDSVTGSSSKLGDGSADDEQHFVRIVRNYVASDLPLNEPVASRNSRRGGSENSVPLLSAGHQQHEYTSWSSIDVLFEFLEKQYRDGEVGNRDSAAKRSRTDL